MATQVIADPSAELHDTFPINGTDYIELYVGNAKQAAQYYMSAFGFQLLGYRGPETGTRDRASYLLQQQKIRIVLTTAITPTASPLAAEIADHVFRHGDGVKDLALWVDDARDAYAKAVERGARAVREPQVLSDDDGEVVIAAIGTYGETVHSLVERRNYNGMFLPGFRTAQPHFSPAEAGAKSDDVGRKPGMKSPR
jgi:4-hydroxyphenylpyruvate dioxygenase